MTHLPRTALLLVVLSLIEGLPALAAPSSTYPPQWHTGAVIKLSSNHASIPLAWRPDSKALLIRNMGPVPKPGGSLWLVGVHGHTRRLLVKAGVQDAVFLPGGRFVLYQEANADWRNLHLRVIDARGRLVRIFHLGHAEVLQNTTGGYGYFMPSLTQALLTNGRIALYRNQHLIELDPLTGRSRLINRRPFSVPLNDSAAVPYAALSPDTRRIAVFSPTSSLTIRDARTGRAEWHTNSPHHVDMVAWSPDSKILAFDGGGMAGELDEVNVVTHHRQRITHFNVYFTSSFAWSPSGSVLAFSAMSSGDGAASGARITFFDRRSHSIYRMDPPAASTPLGEIGPSWAPNGRLLVYTRVFNPTNQALPPHANDTYIVHLVHRGYYCQVTYPVRCRQRA